MIDDSEDIICKGVQLGHQLKMSRSNSLTFTEWIRFAHMHHLYPTSLRLKFVEFGN